MDDLVDNGLTVVNNFGGKNWSSIGTKLRPIGGSPGLGRDPKIKIPTGSTHWKYSKEGPNHVIRFAKKVSEATKLRKIAIARVEAFSSAYDSTIELLNGTSGEYATLPIEKKVQFDSQVEALWRSRSQLFLTQYEFNAADLRKFFGKQGDGGAANPFQVAYVGPEKPGISISDARKKIDGATFLFYNFRGRPEPQGSWFDRAITKVGMAFGASVLVFVTAGAASAVIGTAAPSASTVAGLGTAKGLASGSVPSLGDLASKGAEKAQDKATAAVGGAVDKSLRDLTELPVPSVPKAPQIATQPVGKNLVEEKPLTAEKKTFELAGPGLALGAVVVLALLSIKKG